MILVDTSIWIELLSRKPRPPIPEEDLVRFRTCGPVIQEVLQGLSASAQSHAFRNAFLAIPIRSDPVPADLYIAASDIYQRGRRLGITIRSSLDCLIAAIAIENRVTVWHRDRDFDAIARFTALELRDPNHADGTSRSRPPNPHRGGQLQHPKAPPRHPSVRLVRGPVVGIMPTGAR